MKTIAPPRLNPFPGLRPFRSDEHHLFFGREEQTAALLQLLRTNRFLAVVGTSGSGKSSLVRAGMIAALHGGTMTAAGSTWEVMILRPGGSPLENLARAFLDADLYDPEDPGTLPRLLATLNRSRFGLVEAAKQSGLLEPGTNLLVVVDQFEELFRFRQQGVDSEEAAAAFVNLLLTAGEQAECPIYVTITMRSDYLGDCSEIPGLAEAVNEGEYLIPRLLRDQKRDAIEKPIGVGGAKVSPLLVQRLLNEAGDDPDQLPVLQHALMRMWDAWSAGGDGQRPIDFCDFEATGGLASALSIHADEVYAALPDDRHRAACAKIFKALTEKGSDNRGIRRPTRLARLVAIANADRATVATVLDAFRAPGVTFLMPGPEVVLTDRIVFDLSHESLMRCWQRLRGWVEDEAQSARIFRRLLDTARLWEDGKAGLFRHPDLLIALTWREQEGPNAEWAELYGGHLETALAFLEASNAEVEAERQAREAGRQRELQQAQELAEARKLRLEQQQRAARKLHKVVAGLAVVAVIAGLACAAALLANQRANRLAEEARYNEEQARESTRRAEQSQQETANALAIVASQKTEVEGSLAKAEAAERAARAAEEAGRKLLYTTDMRLAPFVWNDDRSTAEQLRVLLAKHVPDSKPAPTGDAGAVPRPDLRGFEWHYYRHLVEKSAADFTGHIASVIDVALASKGPLVTLDENGQVRRWDLDSQAEDPASRRELPGGPNAEVRSLSPNGQVAALGGGNKVHVFDTSTGDERFQIDFGTAPVRGLILSQDGDPLVVVDNQIRWLSAATGEVIASRKMTFGRGSGLALSADGLTLAVVGHGQLGKQFSIYRLDAAARTVTVGASRVDTGGTASVAALTPDGQRIAIGAKMLGSVSVYDTATGRSVGRRSTAHASPITAVAFAGDGARLATADAEGTIKIWADGAKLAAKSVALRTLKGHHGAIRAMRFSTDGKRLASGSADKTARVWDLDNAGAAIRALERHGFQGCMSARFSPDGQLIASAEGAGVRLWDAATGRLVRDLSGANGSGVLSVAFSPTDPRLLAVGHGRAASDSYVSLWDIDAGRELARLPGATELDTGRLPEGKWAVSALAFSPDGKYLVAGFGSKNLFAAVVASNPLKVWEVATRRLVQRLKGHTGFCVSLDFSRDGKLLASGSRDGTAILWSTETWKPVRTLRNPEKDTQFGPSGRGPAGPSRAGMIDDVAFSPDCKTLALASREGSVQLWSVADGKLLDTLRGHSSAVMSVAFAPDGRTLASGGNDQTVRLWNVETRRELMQLDAGSLELGEVRTLMFCRDGTQLLAGGRLAALWSAAPVLWNDSERAAESLRLVLKANADFRSRIRMLSENLRLHEALARLDPTDARVRAALAATQANWHASRQAWAEAARAFDRLKAADPAEPEGWLRTPGLLRLATALLHQDRPVEAAALLHGGAARRSEDAIPAITRFTGFGFRSNIGEDTVRIAELLPGSPATRSRLLPGDVVVKVDDVELTKKTIPDYTNMLNRAPVTKRRLTVRHPGESRTETIDLVKASFAVDDATGEYFFPLRSALEKQLEAHPRDPGLLELRAELAGQETGGTTQAAEYTAVIKVLAKQPAEGMSARLRRLYQRRGVAYLRLKKWPEAADDYCHVITSQTTDVELLSSRARAFEGMKDWDSAAADWSRAAAGNPEGAKLLADFARRLAARGQIERARALFEKSRALYQRLLEAAPESEPVVAELTGLLWDKQQNESATKWQVLAPAKMESREGATLTLEKDGSVFVSGTIKARDTYMLDLTGVPKKITALRLEALHDTRLPGGGPGTQENGNFVLSELKVFRPEEKSSSGMKPLVLRSGCATFEERLVQQSLEPGESGWSIVGGTGRSQTASFAVARDADPAASSRLRVQLDFAHLAAGDQPSTLGRFRLSVSGDADEYERERGRLAAESLSDPGLKLAAAYALNGQSEEAAHYFGKALERADGHEGRKSVIELACRFGDIASALGKRQPDNPQLQLGLGRQLLERGKQHLDEKQPAKAQEELEKSRAIFTQLLSREARWTVPSPVEMKAETGAKMELQKDGSLFVQQNQSVKHDTYSLVFPWEGKAITGLRLEVLPDSRLPRGGPGWYSNGNFMLSELTLEAAPTRSPDRAREIPLRNASADFSQSNWNIRGAVDGNIGTGWAIIPETNKSHTAVFEAAARAGGGEPVRLTVRLSHLFQSPGFMLGRFRLSFTNDATTPEATRIRLDLKDSEVIALDVALAKAFALQGRTHEAARAVGRALERAPDRAGRTRIFAAAGALEGVLETLAERAAGDGPLLAELARTFAERGKGPLAETVRGKARTLLERQLAAEPDNQAVATALAELLWSTMPPVDQIWIDDAAPSGASLFGDTPWEFVGKPDHPVFRGKKSMRRKAAAVSQHFFLGAIPGLKVDAGARIFAHVYVDPKDPPHELMLQFNDGSWEHRAFWGEDLIAWGEPGKESRVSMGPLPKAGGWARLEVEPETVGVAAGAVLNGWAFTQHGGTCYWDAAGVSNSFETPWHGLVAAYHRLGDQKALDTLVGHHPEAAAGVGDLYAAAQDWKRAVAEYRNLEARRPNDTGLSARLANAYELSGRTREAVPYLTKVSIANPRDTVLSLKVAALQAWFGQEGEYIATRQRVLAAARGTTDMVTAERVAKVCSILGANDKEVLEAAVVFGRTALKLDPGGQSREWNLLALGMAEYRSGQYPAADEALQSAAKAGKDNAVVKGTSEFYRAMSLFRQGKQGEARKVAAAAAEKMKPLPEDEKNPLSGGAYHDHLVLWLAFKEAKALIGFKSGRADSNR